MVCGYAKGVIMLYKITKESIEKGKESYVQVGGGYYGRLRAWKNTGNGFKYRRIDNPTELDIGDQLALVGGGPNGEPEDPFYHFNTSPITGKAFRIDGKFIITTETSTYIVEEFTYNRGVYL